MVLPSLASKIGLNEAIILQQVHYWLDPRGNKNKKEGRHWVYNSYKQWSIQFPFFSDRTIRRTIQNLEKSNLLIAKEFNKSAGDKTKWYSINYEQLSMLELSSGPSGQNGHMGLVKVATPSGQNGQIIYKDTETTTDISFPLIPQPDVRLGEGGGEGDKINPIAEEMIQAWDAIVREGKGAPTFLRNVRIQKLLFALKTYFDNDIKNWKEHCHKIASSKFLMGETKAQFQTKIDWAIIPDNIEKILDGSITIGDRVSNSGMFQGGPQEDLQAQAQALYGGLSSEKIEAYKQHYVATKREKDPEFVWDDHAPLLSSHLRHFIIVEIKKSLVLKN